MKLFAREHVPLVILHVVQLFLVLLVYWLDGYRNVPTALYSVFLGLVALSGYLAYRYVSHRSFYERLSKPPESLDHSIGLADSVPLAASLEQLLKAQYDHYRTQLNTWEKRRTEHFGFMNQWVHQMKTPLSVIQLIVQKEDDPRFDSIREEAEKLQRGMETVLYAARLEAFAYDFHVEPVGLRSVTEKAISEQKRLFITNGVFPEVQIEETLFVETDAKWLAFMLGQLVNNAVKYSAGSKGKVTISAWKQEGETLLEVRDRGIGIPASDRKRVFQPFYTGENGRTYRESTGMGLYLVGEICKLLSHRVELESEVGAGTSIRIAFAGGARRLTEV